MKLSLKHISIILIFMGIFLSCFQLTIIHFSKNYKCNVLFAEDFDDSEDDSETKKIELEDDYFIPEFNYAFIISDNSKTSLIIKWLCFQQPPVLSINTPPPEYKMIF